MVNQNNDSQYEAIGMWYFTWILGVLLALAFGVINVMWYEAEHCLYNDSDDDRAA